MLDVVQAGSQSTAAILHHRVGGLCRNTTLVVLVAGHPDVTAHAPAFAPAGREGGIKMKDNGCVIQ